MKQIAKLIKDQGGKMYLVGGAVRDHFLGRESKDMDYIVCGIPMEDLISLLSRYGRCDLVGKSFGVIKFKYDGVEYDVALPRKEVSTGQGHKDFEVQADYRLSLEVDMARRDFTINAIAQDVETSEYFDFFKGIRDIEAGVLRMVSGQAFQEDPLRVLRGVQFAARFGLTVEDETREKMVSAAPLVSTVSPERISGELVKLLGADKPSVGFELMREIGVLSVILPELAAQIGVPQPVKYHSYDVFGHLMACMDAIPFPKRNKSRKINLRLAALFHDISKDETIEFKEDGTPTFPKHAEKGAVRTRSILERLRMTSVVGVDIDVDLICHLVHHHMFVCDCSHTDKVVRRFVSRVGRDKVVDLIRLRVADRAAKGKGHDEGAEWVAFANRCRTIGHGKPAAFSIKDLAVSGKDVMDILEIGPSKRVGQILASLFQLVLDDPEMNTREGLLPKIEEL